MSAGTKTIQIAKGIALWAAVQAYRTDSYDYLEAEREWLDFSANLTVKEIDFIKREQFRLFDQVNANL